MSSTSTSSWAKWTFWTLVAFAAFIFVAVFTGRVASSHTSYDDQEAAKRKETLRKLKEEEATTMSTPDWVDKTKQIVRLPLNDAFGPALAAMQAKTPHMAEVIPGTVPPPTPTPAPSPTAAPVPSPTPAPTPSSHPTPPSKSPKPSSKPSPAPTKAAHKP